MELDEYRRLRDHERTYWWHVGRRDLLAAMLRWGVPPGDRPGLDVGCGTGVNFGLLAPYGSFVGSEVASELYGEGKPRPGRPVVIARGERLPFADRSITTCTFFDVLEHVEQEGDFLREVHRILQPDGVAFATVPAYRFLWSDHDVSLGHVRRYVRSGLRESFVRHGFEIVRVTYAMATILPLVATYRVLSRFLPRRRQARTSYVPTPVPLAGLLKALLRLEARWLSRADCPFGTSLFVLARKSDR